jgi:hypothetical protein
LGKILRRLIAASLGDLVGRAELMDEAERRRLLSVGNDTATRIPAAGGVHELMAAQAARQPACGGPGTPGEELMAR